MAQLRQKLRVAAAEDRLSSIDFGNLKNSFDDLRERFCSKLRSGNFGILCVLRNFYDAKLGQKIRSNRKRRVLGDAAKNK